MSKPAISADVAIEQGRGIISVEAIDTDGNFRNFLDLQAVVVNPKGERELVPLTQTAAGRYEAEFETRETGSYLVHLREMEQGELRVSQVIGANLDHSPEFAESRPNLARLERLAEVGGGRLLSRDFGADNPFEHDRRETFQPVDLWEWLLKFAVLLFPVDVGVRRIQIDREEWSRWMAGLMRVLIFWRRKKNPKREESLASLLAKRDEARQTFRREQPSAPTEPAPELFQPSQPTSEDSAPLGASAAAVAEPPTTEDNPKPEGDSTTSRLLAAKRKALRKRNRMRRPAPSLPCVGVWLLLVAVLPATAGVRINEIHYRPKNESTAREFIELWNHGKKTVSLAGWRLDRGVDFSFTNQALQPDTGLVIAANPTRTRRATSEFEKTSPAHGTGDWVTTAN